MFLRVSVIHDIVKYWDLFGSFLGASIDYHKSARPSWPVTKWLNLDAGPHILEHQQFVRCFFMK